MRIVQISDVHIRNLRRHDEYRRAFENLYRDLEDLRPDLVVNCGDLAHAKTQISPEFVQVCSDHLRGVSMCAPLHVILGNHDLNLMNPSRQDAISPIVKNLGSRRIVLYEKSGRHPVGRFSDFGCTECAAGGHVDGHLLDSQMLNFWVFSLADRDHYPVPTDWAAFSRDVNIGLFHGSVRDCVTDSDWKMDSAEHGLEMFDGLDYVFMGDIHKRQFFGDSRKIAYAGSLIQQNFGECTEKGYLVWDIAGKDDHRVEFRELTGARKFYTVRLGDDLSPIGHGEIDHGSRIRVVAPRVVSLNEQDAIFREIRERFSPYDIVAMTSPENCHSREHHSIRRTRENVRDLDVQERLIRNFFAGSVLSETVMSRVIELNRKFQVHVEQQDDVARGVDWSVNRFSWDNLFGYGEGNVVDLRSSRGITGVFGPNGSGKSSVVDVMLEGLFDKVTKDCNRNVELINDNRDLAKISVEMRVGDVDYSIERQIERVRYGQLKEKEWGKTSLDFYEHVDGNRKSLNGDTRPETEREIRKRIGSYDDMILTSLLPQDPGLDIIRAKETERRRILFRVLDLDIFDQKCLLAKEEKKELTRKMDGYAARDVGAELAELEKTSVEMNAALGVQRGVVSALKSDIAELVQDVLRLSSQKVRVDCDGDLSKLRDDLQRLGDELDDIARKEQEFVDSIRLNNSLSDEYADRLRAAPSISDLERSLTSAKDERDKLARSVSKMSRHVESHEKELASHVKSVRLLDEVPCGDSYQNCRFLVDAFSSKDKIVPIERLISTGRIELKRVADLHQEAVETVDGLETRLSDVTVLKSDHSATLARRDFLSVHVDSCRVKRESWTRMLEATTEKIQRVARLEETATANARIDSEIAEIELKRKGKERELRVQETRLIAMNRDFGGISESLCRAREDRRQYHELLETLEAYESLIDALGKKGIPYQILTQKLPIINDEINKILSNVVKFSVFIEHDPDEQTIRIYFQFGEYKSRNLGLSGGAEKFLASLALRVALINVSSLPKTNVFIVDEGFGKLDACYLESVQKMFEYLKTVFEHVIVISHVDVLKDMVDNAIDISVDQSGYSHVETR